MLQAYYRRSQPGGGTGQECWDCRRNQGDGLKLPADLTLWAAINLAVIIQPAHYASSAEKQY